MKPTAALPLLALILAACGTSPPMPPECKGLLTPINALPSATISGAVNAPARRP